MSTEIEKFVEACIKRGEAVELGDSRKANKQADIIESIYRLLKENSRLTELISLFNHENLSVRKEAATYTLQLPRSGAEKALKSLSKHRSLIGFEAEMNLKIWRGEFPDLKLPL